MADDVESNPSNRTLRELLSAAASIAIVGVTRVGHAFENPMQLLAGGPFRVIPVLLREPEQPAQRVNSSITAIPDAVDIVVVVDGGAALPSLADDAVRIGARTLWLQPGITAPDIIQRAADVGLTIVVGRDIVKAVIDFGIIDRSSTRPYDIVEEAGRESFPASDPPPWSRVRPGGPRDQSRDASP